MKQLGSMMRRDPRPDEREAYNEVVGIAQAWERGELPLSQVRKLCSGHDRWQAMRFADLGSDAKRSLMALVDALCREDSTRFDTPHGTIGRDELYADVKAATNHAGKRVFVWPMHFKDGQPFYPLVDLPHGEERRRREEAAMRAYQDYRDRKKGRRT